MKDDITLMRRYEHEGRRMAEFIKNHRFAVGRNMLTPLSAEMHYYRVSKDKWQTCLETVRDAYIHVVSTLVPWNLHEYEEGKFDFTGETDERSDLVGFLELCTEMDLWVILRPGPRISGEWPNGGYPSHLFDHPELIARDNQDRPAQAFNCVKLRQEFAVSYLNPRFLASVEIYYRELVDAIRDYIYPEPPVFLIQLDNETSWSFRNGPFDADYNPQIVQKLYPEFLKEKYGRIERMNEIYGSSHGLFAEARPPRSCDVSEAADLPVHLDWIEFKEKHLLDYHSTLRGILEKTNIQAGYCVNMRGGNNYVLPGNWAKHELAGGLLTLDWYWPDLYYQASRYLRYLRTCSRTVRVGEMMAGLWAENPERMQREKPVTPEMQRYCLLMSMAAGMKGANYYMFVERDHWYGSPVSNEGEKRVNFEVFKRTNEIVEQVDLSTLAPLENVSLGVYRPYLWYNHLGARRPFSHINRLTQDVTPQLAATLEHMGCEYSIVDPRVGDSLVKNPILLFESGAFMDSDTQLRLARFVAKGGTLIIYGVLPLLDLRMRSCRTLADAIQLRMYHDESPAMIESAAGDFPVYRFGYLDGPKWDPLWEENGRMVAGRTRMGSGTALFFAASLADAGQPVLARFLDQLMDQCRALRPVTTNISHIRASLHRNDRGMVLYLINTVNMTRHHGQSKWRPIVQFDPRTSDIVDMTYVMTDMFTGERNTIPGGIFVRGLDISMPTQWGARMFHITPT